VTGGSWDSVILEIPLRLSRAHAWDLLWRIEGQQKWLGPQSRIQLNPASRITFCDESGPWRQADLMVCRDLEFVRFRVSGCPGWSGNSDTLLTIRLVDDRDSGHSRLLIKETRIPPLCWHPIFQYWQRRKQSIERLDREIHKRRNNPRQAVVLIHGIGEQQPGEMLYSFLGSGVLGKNEAGSWIKPDRLSESFELRMATLSADHQRPTTDVYEIYWAHVIRDTTINQLASWLGGLMLSWPLRWPWRRQWNKSVKWLWNWNIPKPIIPLWLLLWVLLLGIGLAFIGTVVKAGWAGWILWIISLPLVAFIVKNLWQNIGLPLAINYLGDAARYLQPHPDNIAHRQAIRREGVRLLEKLHESGKYDRVVVVGHSLGSVIAYDILTHAWAKMNALHLSPTSRSRANGEGPFQSLRRVEKAAAENLNDVVRAQSLQHDAWKGMRVNTQPWLVTDLVTLGSPLTYADFLITRGFRPFMKSKRNRSLPICPPWLEVKGPDTHASRNRPYPRLRFSYEQRYIADLDGQPYTFTLCDHAALFAVTRWSNVHTPSAQWGLSGDLVSGPLGDEEHFGRWILDRTIDPQVARFMHTWYWDKDRGVASKSVARMTVMKEVLRMDVRKELIELNQEIPAYSFLARFDD
jgi:hypothetical protein